MKPWLILLPLLACACGIMSLPAKSDVLPKPEIMPTVAQKQPILATFEPSATVRTVFCVTAAETLNLRLAPSTMAEGLGVLLHGDTVVRIGAVPGWLKVEAGERVGWAKAEFVSVCDG